MSVALEGFIPLQFLFTTFGLLWVLWALALSSAKVLLGASLVFRACGFLFSGSLGAISGVSVAAQVVVAIVFVDHYL